MTAAETRAVLAALEAGGFQGRFVGGCVRDTLLGRRIGDIDIATDARPEELVKCLETAGLRAVPTGIDHGTVTAVSDGKPFEITTLRHDVETDGRRAVVRFTDDWEGDAARRDLTINAMSLEADGTLHDPFGGQADLQAGRIRFVGDAHDRIAEDVLRLLRYFRFYAHYGKPPPDPAALTACKAMAPRLPNLSGERVRVELLKLLTAPDPMPVLQLMADADVFENILPEATGQARLRRLIAVEADVGVPVDPLRRLAALLVGDARTMARVGERLRLSNTEKTYLEIGMTETVSPSLKDAERRRALYRLGKDTVRELVLIGWAGSTEDTGWRDLLDATDAWTPKRFPLAGRDVLERGVVRGPAVGALLGAVEDWWIDGNFAAGRDECLARLDAEIAGRR